MINQEDAIEKVPLELLIVLGVSPIPAISDSKKLEYIKFMLAHPELFIACGGKDVKPTMARNLLKIKNKKKEITL